MSKPIVVWSEIPVSDMDASIKFYNAVFGWDMTLDTSGPNPMAVFGSAMDAVGGHLYPGKPANDSGSTIHINVPGKLEEAAERCREAGGSVVSDPIPLPVGRFVYAKDLDGNSIGLFEGAA